MTKDNIICEQPLTSNPISPEEKLVFIIAKLPISIHNETPEKSAEDIEATHRLDQP